MISLMFVYDIFKTSKSIAINATAFCLVYNPHELRKTQYQCMFFSVKWIHRTKNEYVNNHGIRFSSTNTNPMLFIVWRVESISYFNWFHANICEAKQKRAKRQFSFICDNRILPTLLRYTFEFNMISATHIVHFMACIFCSCM